MQYRRPWFNSWFRKNPWRRDRLPTPVFLGFPCGSVGKESVCNGGDTCSIPRSGRHPGEGTGYPLQCSWGSLVAQLVKNPPAVQETWVPSLGWEDPLDKGKATHSGLYSGLENSMDCIVHGVAKSWTRVSDSHFSLFKRRQQLHFILSSQKLCWEEIALNEHRACPPSTTNHQGVRSSSVASMIW